jgi:hypothetical protein
MKPKLINFYGNNNNLTVPLIEENILSSFDVALYDSSSAYDKSSTIFSMNAYQFNENKDIATRLINDGYKFVFENLHEANPVMPQFINYPNVLFMYSALRPNMLQDNVIQVPMYFWYFESKSWGGKIVDYKSLSRINKFEKKFLLMMNRAKSFRTQIYEKFCGIAQDGLISFVDSGVRLDGDIDKDTMYWDRYINIDWYNKTQFSVVVETFMTMDHGDIFITEKSLKPFALKHPYISLSCKNTLSLMKQNGFESFENLFDESYDCLSEYKDRIDHIYFQVTNCNTIGNDYDSLTKQKIEHNHNWFYNDQEINRRIKLEMLDPMLEFINA